MPLWACFPLLLSQRAVMVLYSLVLYRKNTTSTLFLHERKSIHQNHYILLVAKHFLVLIIVKLLHLKFCVYLYPPTTILYEFLDELLTNSNYYHLISFPCSTHNSQLKTSSPCAPICHGMTNPLAGPFYQTFCPSVR